LTDTAELQKTTNQTPPQTTKNNHNKKKPKQNNNTKNPPPTPQKTANKTATEQNHTSKQYWPHRNQRVCPPPRVKRSHCSLLRWGLLNTADASVQSGKSAYPSSLWCHYWTTWLPPNKHFIVQFSWVLP